MALDTGLRLMSTAIGEVGAIGMTCLLALHVADRSVAEDDLLAIIHLESLSTLRRHLGFCAAHNYVSSIKPGAKRSALWHITDIGRSLVMRVISLFGLPPAASSTGGEPRLITAPDVIIQEKNFFSAPSSSSDLIDQSSESGSRSDQIEEEEEGREFKKFLCREYNLTGSGAQAVIDDPRIWSDDLVAWMFHVRQMQREKFAFRKSPESYALGCLLKIAGPDSAPENAYAESKHSLNLYWEQFQKSKEQHDD